MSTKCNLEPYIFFQGNCKEAMEFYKSVFGGEVAYQMADDAPVEMPDPESMKGKVMHASLDGGAVKFMGSDSPKASAKAAKIELSVGGDDEEGMRKMFDALSEGGQVKFPLKKQFWGDIFGQLTDKYGIDWMFNIAGKN